MAPRKVDPCPIRFASLLTPWAATMARRSCCRAPKFRSTRHPDIEFLLFGDRAVVEPLLDALPSAQSQSRFVHTDVAIRMDDKPSQALRHGRWKSSMWLAIDAVKKGEADVAISAGNTGALMAMASFNLKMHARASSGRRSRRCGRRSRASRSCSMSAPRSAPTRSIWSISPSWAAPWRACCSISNGRPSACSISASRRSRGSNRCAKPAASCARATSRISTMPASSRATISARARSTWW